MLKYNIYLTICVIALASIAFSEVVLQGVVMDPGKEPIANASIELVNTVDSDITFQTTTNEQGEYRIQIEPTSVQNGNVTHLAQYQLLQNYPNPFNPSTMIIYVLPQPAKVRITVYNALGQKIKTLFNGFQVNRTGQVIWDATNDHGHGVAAGIYFYSLESANVHLCKKMLLLDGHSVVAEGAVTMMETQAQNDRNFLNKKLAITYNLKVTGVDIETAEQKNLTISGITVLNITTYKTVTDIDNNIYRIRKIGSQWWMAGNLKTTRYRNGDIIANVTTAIEWRKLTSGACCPVNGNAANKAVYGLLYNYYAVLDSRGLAPEGWHIPNDEEWKILEMFLGMSRKDADTTMFRGTTEGGMLKETGTTHWRIPNTGATNSTGFTALPAGYRNPGGDYFDLGSYGFFWTSTSFDNVQSWTHILHFDWAGVYRYFFHQGDGFSVRCIKD